MPLHSAHLWKMKLSPLLSLPSRQSCRDWTMSSPCAVSAVALLAPSIIGTRVCALHCHVLYCWLWCLRSSPHIGQCCSVASVRRDLKYIRTQLLYSPYQPSMHFINIYCYIYPLLMLLQPRYTWHRGHRLISALNRHARETLSCLPDMPPHIQGLLTHD